MSLRMEVAGKSVHRARIHWTVAGIVATLGGVCRLWMDSGVTSSKLSAKSEAPRKKRAWVSGLTTAHSVSAATARLMADL